MENDIFLLKNRKVFPLEIPLFQMEKVTARVKNEAVSTCRKGFPMENEGVKSEKSCSITVGKTTLRRIFLLNSKKVDYHKNPISPIGKNTAKLNVFSKVDVQLSQLSHILRFQKRITPPKNCLKLAVRIVDEEKHLPIVVAFSFIIIKDKMYFSSCNLFVINNINSLLKKKKAKRPPHTFFQKGKNVVQVVQVVAHI